MAVLPRNLKYLCVSLVGHICILLVLMLGFAFSSTIPVFENTNKNDVMSAVVLGDSPHSKVLPQATPPPPPPNDKKVLPQEQRPAKQTQQEQVENAIAIEAAKKKKLAEQKTLAEKNQHEMIAKDLLADIKKMKAEQKKLKQKALQSQIQKTLREQAEHSLRQQLLNEEIKLQTKQSRQAQGEVNKYKALILQAISEHWIIPPQVDKNLYCELMIRLAPGGIVLDVQITKKSGDPSLDSSVRAAILKASPLPVPTESAAFEPFRQFVLKVKPENILSNDGSLSFLTVH